MKMMVGPRVTRVGRPRLALARVRVASQEVTVVNLARAQLVEEETVLARKGPFLAI